MRLKNFDYFLVLLIFSISFLPLAGEEKIDIWKNKKEKPSEILKTDSDKSSKETIIKKNLGLKSSEQIKIEDGTIDNDLEAKVYGVYDPADYDFNINMWSSTNANDLRASLKRIKKLNYRKLLKTFWKMFYCHSLIPLME